MAPQVPIPQAPPQRHFSLGLAVLAKDSILINSYQPPERRSSLRNKLPLNLVRLPILEELESMSMNIMGEF